MKVVFFDIGNTRAKFLNNNKVFIIQTKLLETSSILNRYFPISEKIIYFGSCVNENIRKLLKKHKNVYFLKDFKRFIVTKYDFNKVGEDRLASIYFPKNKNFLTLQLGTLYTLDLVKNNLHLGGYLFPSLKTIKEGVENSTFIKLLPQEKLLSKIQDINIKTIPKNTLEAILKSYLIYFFSFLKNIVKNFSYPLYISGGDYKFLETHFSSFGIKYFYESFMVLKGLKNFFYKFKIYKYL